MGRKCNPARTCRICIYLLMIQSIRSICSSTCPANRGTWSDESHSYEWTNIPTGHNGFWQLSELCRNISGYVATPNSPDENQHLLDMMRSVGVSKMWIGCTDKEIESVWVCEGRIPGTDLYTNWADSEPIRNNDCARMQSSDGKWLASTCGMVMEKLLCEVPAPRPRFTPRVCKPLLAVASPSQWCLQNHITAEILVKRPVQCLMACLAESECSSINLTGTTCQLNNATIAETNAAKDFAVTDDCQHYDIRC